MVEGLTGWLIKQNKADYVYPFPTACLLRFLPCRRGVVKRARGAGFDRCFLGYSYFNNMKQNDKYVLMNC